MSMSEAHESKSCRASYDGRGHWKARREAAHEVTGLDLIKNADSLSVRRAHGGCDEPAI
jgi:hypothetical protein